ncbi:DUF177 domain-containing protein [Vogesella sp. XCS3]|uniref:YceD family protein n=1 Tax=Vogesella sp. XCS3 TaxID=2877939 RepID=UPI001D0A9DF3|nr:YceD family protein [Vogesella sp. XCS3]UDM17100.1 DUF177 domain-containing protein [Vogesella sp. XCS3]
MSNPILIDPLAFARDGGLLESETPVAAMNVRVHEVLASTAGAARFTVSGFSDRLRRPSLRYRVEANVEVNCQRCLAAMPLEVVSEGVITLFVSEAKLEAAVNVDDELDAILAEETFDVTALIEDEIIMGLPLSPKHDDCGTEHLERAKADKPNPFAVLATLKKSGS